MAPWLIVAGWLAGCALVGCVDSMSRCPGAPSAPIAPVTSDLAVDPIDPIRVVDAWFIDRDTLTVIVRYDGGSEPHRIALHLRQPWPFSLPDVTTYQEGVLVRHEAPANAGRGERVCRLDFDFRGEPGKYWMVYADREEAISVTRTPRGGYDRRPFYR